MKSGLFDGGEDAENNGVGFVGIFAIIVIQDFFPILKLHQLTKLARVIGGLRPEMKYHLTVILG